MKMLTGCSGTLTRKSWSFSNRRNSRDAQTGPLSKVDVLQAGSLLSRNGCPRRLLSKGCSELSGTVQTERGKFHALGLIHDFVLWF